jgi:hypothetical protein
MNALIFTDADAQTLIAAQSGRHRLAPAPLTDGRWFLMEDVLAEIPDGLFGEMIVGYEVAPFESIQSLIPAPEDIP